MADQPNADLADDLVELAPSEIAPPLDLAVEQHDDKEDD